MRSQSMARIWAGAMLLAVATALPLAQGQPTPVQFKVRFDPQFSAEPFTGRILVMLSRGMFGQPKTGPNWFNPEPMFAIDVRNLKPGEVATIDDAAVNFPAPPSALKPGKYAAQAVLDFGRGRSCTNAPGNGFSKVERIEIEAGKPLVANLLVDQTEKPRKFRESDRVKLVELQSKLLTAFHGRPVALRAGVLLPEGFASNLQARFPVIYEIPGFGGDHHSVQFMARRKQDADAGVEFLHVVLDPECPTGHHVFADSENNGPYGQALVEELIPEIEKRFRAVAGPGGRFVTGHSSGGWSSLWLQVAYPDYFGGVWSTSPDPVDFRSFQYIDIYKPGANMFVDEQGQRRPIARRGETPMLYYKPFSDMEEVMGHGGQLASFEAVFSPKAADGKPRKLWDRKTGAIDPQTAAAWKKYDIRLVLERGWPTLAPKLRGKLHVYMGDLDTFYLEGAVRLLKESLSKLGSDAKVELFPGKDHGTLLDGAMRRRIQNEMLEQFRRLGNATPAGK